MLYFVGNDEYREQVRPGEAVMMYTPEASLEEKIGEVLAAIVDCEHFIKCNLKNAKFFESEGEWKDLDESRKFYQRVRVSEERILSLLRKIEVMEEEAAEAVVEVEVVVEEEVEEEVEVVEEVEEVVVMTMEQKLLALVNKGKK